MGSTPIVVKDRADLPTGTVTFLFSDIEGSTRLLQSLGDRYPETLEAHHRLLRDAFAAYQGTVVHTEGDSFFVVFPAAPYALAAAVASQRALAGHVWPDEARVRVRIGLHTGQGVLGADDYVGLDVHRAARIASAGHGGQLLISESTRSLVEHALPEGTSLRDLGHHRLRDIARPERLYQVVMDRLMSDFPPLRTEELSPGNMPTPLTSFIGREGALREVKDLISRSKLVTLTGPGGTGKTSLALRAASDAPQAKKDGVFLVRLGSIADPDLVVPTIAQVLEIEENPRRQPVDLVVEHLQSKELLLVLDNFEQVLPAAHRIAEILERAGRVRALVTSREPLGLQGERQYLVPPMEIPDRAARPSPDQLARYEAIALFVERASAVRPGFRLTEENGAAVAEICVRLDGLPLAIELAAAQIKILAPEAILARLEQRLPLLAAGSRDVPARQRTLRDAIAWSYGLLDERARVLFARLSVFEGGFTLAAVEAICDGSLGDTFEGIASLVNKSLLRPMETIGREPRFAMLETIRDFAAERLVDDDAAQEIERRHVDYFLALAEQAEPELTGPRQARFLDSLAADHDNLRAALDRAVAHGWAEIALKLGAALWRFWQMRGHLREGRERLAGVLAQPDAAQHPEARIRALRAAGSVAYWIGDMIMSRGAYQRALDLSRVLGDRRAVAESLYDLAFPVALQGEEGPALDLLRDALTTFREVGDRLGQGKTLWALQSFGGYEDGGAATTALHEALDIFREAGSRFQEGWALRSLALREQNDGRMDDARGHLREGLEIFRAAADVSAMTVFLESFAQLAIAEGDVERAIRLAGAATAARRATGTGIAQWLSGSEERQALVEGRKASDAEVARLWAEGERMSVHDAVAYALGRS